MILKSNTFAYESVFDVAIEKGLFGKQSKVATEIFILFLGAFLIALSAQIYIPLPFTPVPITLQTYSVLTLSTLLGSRRAPLSVGIYLLLSLIGFPVLAEGRSGSEVMMGATGGYLVGFIFASYAVGLLTEKGWDRSFVKGTLAFTLGQLLIFIPGLLWLGQFVGYESVLEKGFYPFILGGVIKSLLGVTTSVLVWKWIQQIKSKRI